MATPISLVDQVRLAVEKGAEAERRLSNVGHSLAQTAQVAYSLNCIWLYAKSDTVPSKEVLAQALPPLHDGTPEATERTVEYVRKTLIVVRGLVSEKIEDAFRANKDLSDVKAVLGEAIAVPEFARVEQLNDQEVEEIVDEMVPMAIRPRTSSDSSAGSTPDKKKGKKKEKKIETKRRYLLG